MMAEYESNAYYKAWYNIVPQRVVRTRTMHTCGFCGHDITIGARAHTEKHVIIDDDGRYLEQSWLHVACLEEQNEQTLLERETDEHYQEWLHDIHVHGL